MEVAILIVEGYSSKEIAQLLAISSKTVEKHRNFAYGKLNVSTVIDLARWVLRNKLIKPEEWMERQRSSKHYGLHHKPIANNPSPSPPSGPVSPQT